MVGHRRSIGAMEKRALIGAREKGMMKKWTQRCDRRDAKKEERRRERERRKRYSGAAKRQ